jgi:hypothetical protein
MIASAGQASRFRGLCDPGDGDGEDALILDRPLDGLDRRIEALDVANHQRHAGAAGRSDIGVSLLNGRRDRLLDHDMDAVGKAIEGDIAVQLRRGGDRNRINAFPDQGVDIAECRAAQR